MRVLFVRFGALGDVVRAIPAARVVADSGFEVFWLTRDAFKPLLKREGFIPFSWGELFRFRGIEFYLIFDLQGLFKSALSTCFFKGKVVGPSLVKEPSRPFYKLKIPIDPRKNRVFRNLELVRKAGIEGEKPVFKLTIRERDLEKALSIQKGPFIAVHPGSSPTTPYKRWDEEKYAKLLDMLYARLGMDILLSYGDRYELMICTRIKDMCRAPIKILKRQPLTVLSSLYSLARVFIGNDTGPLHLASLSGAPTVGIFGPTDVHVNFPVGENKISVVHAKVPCSPCRNRRCAVKRCFDPIDPKKVFNRVLEVL